MSNSQAGPVRTARVRDVALVTLANPPVNTLTLGVLAALSETFARLALDSTLVAVVLLAEGKYFSAGADLRDLGAGNAAALRDLCHGIENFHRPVIAAMQGTALGSAANLVLAAHYRLTAPTAGMGFPELTLGMVPMAGATQRLPRIVGADVALRLLLSGRPMPAEAGRSAGLIDGVVNGDLVAGALAFAHGLLAQGKGPRPTHARRDKLRDGVGFLYAVEHYRATAQASPVQAASRIVDCVEAALLLPFATGCATEALAFDETLAHPQSVALRHVFLAERQVSDTLLTKAPWTCTEPGRNLTDALLRAMTRATDWLQAQGVTPAQIDATLCTYGFAQGPFGGRAKGPLDLIILRRILAALMAEGARQVGAGAVATAADIDALAVHGAGFPRLQGGPMRATQSIGLAGLRHDMRDWGQQDQVWDVPPLLDQAAKVAGGFDG